MITLTALSTLGLFLAASITLAATIGQWITYRQQFKLAMFDKRYLIHRYIEESFIPKIFDGSINSNDLACIHNKIQEAKFFFNEATIDCLKRLSKKVLEKLINEDDLKQLAISEPDYRKKRDELDNELWKLREEYMSISFEQLKINEDVYPLADLIYSRANLKRNKQAIEKLKKRNPKREFTKTT